MMASMDLSDRKLNRTAPATDRTAGGRLTGAGQNRPASCYFARPWLFLSIHDIVKTVAGTVAGALLRPLIHTGHRYVSRPIVQDDGGKGGLRPVHLLRRADQHQDQRGGLADLYPADGRRNRPPHRLR